MRSKGYRKCRTCEASVPPHQIYCRPCGDRRRDEREAKYRKAKQEREYDPDVAPCDDAEFGMKP